MSLPARVRITRPPLPLAPTLARAVQALCPDATQPTYATLAIAGGTVIGAYLQWEGGESCEVMPAWRNKGIESALKETI